MNPPTLPKLRAAWRVIGARLDADPELRDALRDLVACTADLAAQNEALTARLAAAEGKITALTLDTASELDAIDDAIERACEHDATFEPLARERGRAA